MEFYFDLTKPMVSTSAKKHIAYRSEDIDGYVSLTPQNDGEGVAYEFYTHPNSAPLLIPLQMVKEGDAQAIVGYRHWMKGGMQQNQFQMASVSRGENDDLQIPAKISREGKFCLNYDQIMLRNGRGYDGQFYLARGNFGNGEIDEKCIFIKNGGRSSDIVPYESMNAESQRLIDEFRVLTSDAQESPFYFPRNKRGNAYLPAFEQDDHQYVIDGLRLQKNKENGVLERLYSLPEGFMLTSPEGGKKAFLLTNFPESDGDVVGEFIYGALPTKNAKDTLPSWWPRDRAGDAYLPVIVRLKDGRQETSVFQEDLHHRRHIAEFHVRAVSGRLYPMEDGTNFTLSVPALPERDGEVLSYSSLPEENQNTAKKFLSDSYMEDGNDSLPLGWPRDDFQRAYLPVSIRTQGTSIDNETLNRYLAEGDLSRLYFRNDSSHWRLKMPGKMMINFEISRFSGDDPRLAQEFSRTPTDKRWPQDMKGQKFLPVIARKSGMAIAREHLPHLSNSREATSHSHVR